MSTITETVNLGLIADGDEICIPLYFDTDTDLTSAFITVTPPSGVSYASVTIPRGTYNNVTNKWNIGPVLASEDPLQGSVCFTIDNSALETFKFTLAAGTSGACDDCISSQDKCIKYVGTSCVGLEKCENIVNIQHYHEVQAVAYTGSELPTTVGNKEGDTVVVEFTTHNVYYTFDGTDWIKDFDDKYVNTYNGDETWDLSDGSNLDIVECFTRSNVRMVTSNTDLIDTDKVLLVDNSLSAITINIDPAAMQVRGCNGEFDVKVVGAAPVGPGSDVTLNATSGKIVDTQSIADSPTSVGFTARGETIRFVTDGTNIYILCRCITDVTLSPVYAPAYTPTYFHTYSPNYAPNYTPSYTPSYTPQYIATYVPSYVPTYLTPSYAPVYTPIYAPNYTPVYAPNYTPTYAQTYTPSYAPVYTPIYTPIYAPVYTPVYAPSYTPDLYTPNYAPIYAPIYAPTYTPVYLTPTYTPIYTPIYAPVYTPVYTPTYAPNYVQTYTPTYLTPTYAPVYTPDYAPNYAQTYVPTYTPVT